MVCINTTKTLPLERGASGARGYSWREWLGLKHTPGPWNRIKREDNRIYVGTAQKPIADICNLYGAESEANLALIAAAPDLYRELKRFCTACDDYSPGDKNCKGCTAGDALTKAEGRRTN